MENTPYLATLVGLEMDTWAKSVQGESTSEIFAGIRNQESILAIKGEISLKMKTNYKKEELRTRKMLIPNDIRALGSSHAGSQYVLKYYPMYLPLSALPFLSAV